MSILKIVKYGDPVLKKKCKPVESVTPEIKKLASDMLDTMYANSGIGLAACQVGVPLRICVIDTKPGGNKKPIVLINPRIISTKGTLQEEEGCLSFPSIVTAIKRYKEVKVNAINEDGLPVVVDGQDLLSRALQHEIDHLDGKVFISRLPFFDSLKMKYIIAKRKKQGNW